MGVTPPQTWRGSYLDNHPQAKSTCLKIINGAVVIFGISYLLYVIVVAIGPLVEPAHSAVKLRVHLRTGTGIGGSAGDQASQTSGKISDNGDGPMKLVMPGHNQAPSLQTGMQPELEALTGEGTGKIASDSAVAGGQAAGKEGKAFQQPLKQKGSGVSGQTGKLEGQESRKTGARAQGKKDSEADLGDSNNPWDVGGSDGKEVKMEKELMVAQQQREQLENQLKANFGNVSQEK